MSCPLAECGVSCMEHSATEFFLRMLYSNITFVISLVVKIISINCSANLYSEVRTGIKSVTKERLLTDPSDICDLYACIIRQGCISHQTVYLGLQIFIGWHSNRLRK